MNSSRKPKTHPAPGTGPARPKAGLGEQLPPEVGAENNRNAREDPAVAHTPDRLIHSPLRREGQTR